MARLCVCIHPSIQTDIWINPLLVLDLPLIATASKLGVGIGPPGMDGWIDGWMNVWRGQIDTRVVLGQPIHTKGRSGTKASVINQYY